MLRALLVTGPPFAVMVSAALESLAVSGDCGPVDVVWAGVSGGWRGSVLLLGLSAGCGDVRTGMMVVGLVAGVSLRIRSSSESTRLVRVAVELANYIDI